MKIHQLFIGKPIFVTPQSETTSAINKTSKQTIQVNTDSINGDHVANTIHHGGINRVLHHIPLEHYLFWRGQYKSYPFALGSLGENLCGEIGMNEHNVCIGDVYRIGNIEVMVTEPRKPCHTIDLQTQIKGLARDIQNQMRTGWFYRIITPGEITCGDSIQLISRKNPELTLANCINALLLTPRPKILQQMIDCDDLSMNWREPAKEVLKSGHLIDDRNRLGELPST